MRKTEIAIVGAGIGGPVLALWLERLGREVVVLEGRRRAMRADGAFLGVAPNGMRALEGLGLAERVLARGHACEAFELASSTGRVLGRFDRRGDAAAYGWPLTMIRRSDLHAVLTEACEERGVRIGYEQRLESLDERHDGIRLSFTGAAETRRTDGDDAAEGPASAPERAAGRGTLEAGLVVGCDGLRSRTRVLAMPHAPAPVWSGLLDVGGFAPRIAGLPFGPGVNVMVFGEQAFFGAFSTAAGETWWFHNGPGEAREGGEALRARLLALHARDPAWVRALIEATPSLLGPWGLYELAAMPAWSAGRVCLMGDAAHAMSPSAGQGASMAFEDALVLSQCLRDVGTTPAAFQRFEALRRARVDTIMARARATSSSKAPGPIGRWVRDRMLPLVLPFAEKQQSAAYAHALDWSQRVA